MARWQLTRFGQPQNVALYDDGQAANPMEAAFDPAKAPNMIAANLGISLGVFANLQLALAAVGYGYNYVGAS